MDRDGAVVAVVTGASRDIGRVVARTVGRCGARLGVVARNREDVERVLGEGGGRGLALAVDVGGTERATGSGAARTRATARKVRTLALPDASMTSCSITRRASTTRSAGACLSGSGSPRESAGRSR